MSEILPALPAWPFELPGHTLTVKDLRNQLTKLGRDDLEAAHVAEAELARRVLQQIRDGHPDPAGLATAALGVLDTDFEGWCA